MVSRHGWAAGYWPVLVHSRVFVARSRKPLGYVSYCPDSALAARSRLKALQAASSEADFWLGGCTPG